MEGKSLALNLKTKETQTRKTIKRG